jgi:phosphotransacetylase
VLDPLIPANRTFDEIAVGESMSVTRELTPADVALVATMARGLVMEIEGEAPDGEHLLATSRVGYSGWVAALVPTILATVLPGPGTIYRSQSLRFADEVHAGDVITMTLTVTEKHEACRGHEPVPTAVAYPCEQRALIGAVEAGSAGLIVPILVGPEADIRALAEAESLDLAGIEIVEADDAATSAAAAVDLVRAHRARMVMKGSLHTDELMRAVLDRAAGLRAIRRVSHVFMFDVPTYPKPLFVTDAAINITPTLEDKADICRNAIELGHAVGIERPKLAILGAVEVVNPAMPSTIDAAALCKMADRGQITGGELDGPLAMDNAISPAAARTKHIVSGVAGDADVLVVPDLEAGNILYKNLTYLARADAAGIVLGARVPVVLTSRTDTVRTRLASAALGAQYSRWQRTPRPDPPT